jgi:hypothetical protein
LKWGGGGIISGSWLQIRVAESVERVFSLS